MTDIPEPNPPFTPTDDFETDTQTIRRWLTGESVHAKPLHDELEYWYFQLHGREKPTKADGLVEKYNVTRTDGSPTGPCIVLEFDDPLAWDAISTWANEVGSMGYVHLSDDVIQKLHEAKVDYTERNA